MKAGTLPDARSDAYNLRSARFIACESVGARHIRHARHATPLTHAMNARFPLGLCLALTLVACTHKSDDSPAMSKAKADTNTAIDATRGAIVNATDAARDEARDLADRTKAAALAARESPEMQKAKADLKVAVDRTADKTKELAEQAKEKVSN